MIRLLFLAALFALMAAGYLGRPAAGATHDIDDQAMPWPFVPPDPD